MNIPTIADKNQAFEAATKQQKRKLIAQDVIDQVKVEKYIPHTGIYTSLSRFDYGIVTRSPTSAMLKHRDVTCTCCGIGSMFVSSCALGKKNTVLKGGSPISTNNSLRRLFGTAQLALIEIAFEQWEPWVRQRTATTEQERRGAYRFGMRYDDDTERLLAIMNNIIANGGRFVPVKRRKKRSAVKASVSVETKAPVAIKTAAKVQQRLHLSVTGQPVLV